MIGYKVLTKDGLKGPFKKSSILKAITSAMIPLQARLLDLETGRYLSAAELVGEQVEPAEEEVEDAGLDTDPFAEDQSEDSNELKLDD